MHESLPRFGEALSRRVDRRVVLKATAAFGAMSAVGAARVRPGRAQNAETIAGTWSETGGTGSSDSGEGVVFKADFPFYAVGAHWGGDTDLVPRLEMSFSADGVSFTEPVAVGAAVEDAGRPERDGRVFSDLVFTDEARFVRYRTLDDAGEPVQVPDLALTYINAAAGPTIDDVYAAALEPALSPPPIISRAAWGANETYRYNANGVIWPPEYRTVEHVIIHHTDTANFQDPLVAMRSIYYYHAITRGWGDIGYNYLVDYMGNVYEGRAGGENVVGGHAYQYAYGSSGIGTIGRFSFESETPEAQAGLVWITAWVGRKLDPLGRADFHETPNLPTICGHRDVNESTCPGDYLYGDLPTIRQYVNAVLNEGASPEPASPAFAAGDVVSVVVPDGNLRSGPGLTFPVIAEMALGTLLTVVDGPTTHDGHTWYAVTGSYGDGWSASFLLQATGNGAPAPSSFRTGDSVVVDTDVLNLRNSPGLAGGVIARLPFGTQGTVVGDQRVADGYGWTQLETDQGTGWAASSFLAPASSSAPPSTPAGGFSVGDKVVVNTDALNLRSGPGFGQTVIATMPTGTPLDVTVAPQQVDGSVWYGVNSERYGGGWVAGEFLAPAGGSGGGLQVGDTVQVIDGSLNFRSGPGTSASIVNVVPEGTRFTVIGGPVVANGYSWYQVENGSYGAGWSVGTFLRPV